MSYRALPVQLQSTADEAIRFCKLHWGVGANQIQIEKPIVATVGFVTTLHFQMKDQHWLCIEVCEGAYVQSLDQFVLECKNDGLPVRLYVATSATQSPTFQFDLARAKRSGVGVIQLTNGVALVLAEAVSLSLSGVRAPDPKQYSGKYRQALAEALATFCNGNPVKGCGVVYDEIERLTKRIAEKAKRKGCWRNLPSPGKAPQWRRNEAWARIAKILLNHFDAGKAGCPSLNEALLARVLGVTSHRNDSGHKPTSLATLRRRDRELRTRFESACDLLQELARAAAPFRV